ncbi:hypothetical protein SLS56_004451 [Neofusicoccum ribis]|uniref:Uncharacterized protein n=1 Tax=Neofusicoccum ribis TaxID=45134 RepID=A0ABR3SWA0_9PEZI
MSPHNTLATIPENNATPPSQLQVRPTLPQRKSSDSITQLWNERAPRIASGFWNFVKYGPEIPDTEERLNSVVPTDPEKRKLPWRRWE